MCIPPMAKFERFQPGIQSALFLVEQAAKQNQQGLGFFNGKIGVCNNQRSLRLLQKRAARLDLSICYLFLGGQIYIDRFELFTLKALFSNQLAERMFGFNLNNVTAVRLTIQ